MPNQQEPGFYVLPFALDGEPTEIGFWKQSLLSPKWIKASEAILTVQPESFDVSWEGNLSHIRTKLTSNRGAGVGTFFAHGEVAASMILLSGDSPAIETEVTQLFIESLKRTFQTVLGTQSELPFERIFAAKERPLMVVVPWPHPKIADIDHEIVRELVLHFADAYFSWKHK